MKHSLLISLLLVAAFAANCQTAEPIKKIDFEDPFNLDTHSPFNVHLTTEFKSGQNPNQSLEFEEDGSSIVFKGLKNLKKIKLKYVSNFGGDAAFITSYRNGTDPSGEFTPTKNPKTIISVKNTVSFITVTLPIYVLGSNYDVKVALTFPNHDNGKVAVDDLQFEYFTAAEVNTNEQIDVFDKKTKDLENKIKNGATLSDYNVRVEKLANNYPKNLPVIRELYKSANGLGAISNAFQFVERRTAMYDPSSYAVFKEKIEQMKNYADPLQRSFLDSLVEDLRAKPMAPIPATNGLAKFASVAGDIANLFTAGHFKSIVNSVQGLLTNVFNVNNLSTSVPQVLNNARKARGESPLKTKAILKSDEVAKVVKQGQELQSFFFDFFGRLEKSKVNFGLIVGEFRDYSIEIEELIVEIKDNETRYFAKSGLLVSPKMLDRYRAGLNVKGVNFLDSLRDQSRAFLLKRRMETPKDIATVPVVIDSKEIEEAEAIVSTTDQLVARHEALGKKLTALLQRVENDLNQPNPFIDVIKKDAQGQPLKYPGADEFEDMKKQAKTKLESVRNSVNQFLSPISRN